MTKRLLVLAGLLAWSFGAGARQESPVPGQVPGPIYPQQQQAFGVGNDDDFYRQALQQSDQAGAAKEAAAQANFDTLLVPQNAPAPDAGLVVPDFTKPASAAPERNTAGEVRLPLARFEQVWQQLEQRRRRQSRRQGPAVILGAADYQGRAVPGGLHLRLHLQVTLGRPGVWKTVPLLGAEAALVAARVDGRPVLLSRRSGFHVWVTKQTGEARVEVEFLVPSRGPRGSVEYDFIVARTPVTRFECTFPVADLQPRLDAAVQSTTSSLGGVTRLSATLRPTTRIHLVGFRDLGAASEQQARVYAETLNLVAVDEGALDVFTVLRYTILYAGTKQFVIRIPPGLEVVSADGEGAFRYQLEKTEQGTLLRGETAFPIRNSYEISLRLHRELSDQSAAFTVPLPRCQGVEREHGWLGVEVPGKLLLEQQQAEQVLAIDARQLPEEMVRSAVSPILRAYRYHSQEPRVVLRATRLPEKEPESGSIDRVRAVTTIAPDGHIMTDLRLTLRNRLRHGLALTLPAGTRVLSSHLDDQKVKPSRDEQGRLLLPLKRSAGRERLQAFTVAVVLESHGAGLGLLGRARLQLPALDLPVASLEWRIHAPAHNLYTRPQGDIAGQLFSGRASWHTGGGGGAGGWGEETNGNRDLELAELTAAGPLPGAHSGAMPVRIKIPEHGRRLEYRRYWLQRGQPVEVTFWHARRWLRLPAWWSLAGLLALALLLLTLGRAPARRPGQLVGGVLLGLAVLWPLLRLGGVLGVVLGLLGGLVLVGWRRQWLRRAPAWLLEWARTWPERFRQRSRDPAAWTGARVAGRMALAIGMCFFGLLVLEIFFDVTMVILLD